MRKKREKKEEKRNLIKKWSVRENNDNENLRSERDKKMNTKR